MPLSCLRENLGPLAPPYPSEKGSSYLVRSGKQDDKVSGQKVQGKCHHVESQMMN
jgi:hypothetical protein